MTTTRTFITLLGLLVLIALIMIYTNVQANRPLSAKQQHFVARLAIQVKQQNTFILSQRAKIQRLYAQIASGQALSKPQAQWLFGLAKSYKLTRFSLSSKNAGRLLMRVNAIPPSLVIAQAINESAWGTSRFAKQGNNLFGMWCYHPGCGMVPRARPANRTYEVKRYPNQQASINAYFYNLNTNRYYADFRRSRFALAAAKQPLTGLSLVKHLHIYSQKGDRYVAIISALINRYDLQRYDSSASPRPS